MKRQSTSIKLGKVTTTITVVLISTFTSSCSIDIRGQDEWWRYTYIGSSFADDLVGISSVVTLVLMIISGIFGSILAILFTREETVGLAFAAPIAIGGIGFAVIRGLFQHWAWWIVRWDQASIFRDFLFGTVMFMLIGGLCGALLGLAVSLASMVVCYPIFYPFRWIVARRRTTLIDSSDSNRNA